jgi:hypothetical protein
MLNRILTALTGLLLSSTVWAADLSSIFSGCNINGLAQIDAARPEGDHTFGWPLGDQATHVLLARLGNNGKGNGGEAYDLHFWGALGGVFGVDCISTADEDTGGALISGDPADPFVFPNSQFAPETDPGRGRR